MALLRLYSNGPNNAYLTILNGNVVTGYALMVPGLDFGNAVWEHAFSGPIGTQGARPSIGVPQNRVSTWPIRVVGAASKDAMLAKVQAAAEIADDMRRYGGSILWQSASQTYRQWFRVKTCAWALATWDQSTETNYVLENILTAVCAPYLDGDPMDTLDTFATDSIADYTASTGNSGTLTVANGVLIPSSTAVKIYRHTAKGYSLADVEVTLKVSTAGTVTSGVWGVTARADTAGADTALVAEFVAGTNVIRVGKYIAGAFTSLATAAATPAINTTYWVRLRLEENVCKAELFTHPNAPTPTSTPTATATYTLTIAEAGRFVVGNAGVRITPASTSETYDDFTVSPYTYRLVNTPEQIRLGPTAPGDVPAAADIILTPLGGAATPVWGLVGWLERPAIVNWCWNGDFESATIAASGWTNAAVTGITAAATSVARDTTAALNKYGVGNLAIVSTTTSGSGGSFQVFKRFKQGRQYAALAWAASAAGTAVANIKLGVNGDLGTGTAVAISATKKVYSVVWTPTADRESAYVAFCCNTTVAQTMNIDGVVVVEGPSIALSAAIASAGAASMTVYSTPSEIPNWLPDGSLSAPFLVMIEQEIIRVTAVTGTTWQIDRGQEGSTAASHAIDLPVVILPMSRPQYEGKGAVEAFGMMECEGYVPALSSVTGGALTTTSDANAHGGFKLTWTPATSGAQTGILTYLFDPNSLWPDDYTQGEIDVEVFLREAWFTSLTNLRVTLSAQPEGGSTAGPERFTREWGNAGKLIQTAGAKVSRQHRLGTLPLVVDPSNPQRWRLKLAVGCTGGATPTWDFDHFTLIATRGRSAWPTGKANDIASAAATYPSFVPYDASWGATSTISKRLLADGSATVAIPGGYAFPDYGPGRPIELPDRDVDLVVKLSTRVPDDPTIDSTDEATANLTTSVHVAVIPRYVIGRST